MNETFVVGTNKYAGNFEREMCAYMTGVIGDCEVGKPEANLYFEKYDSAIEGIRQHPDEHGVYRPVNIVKDEYGEFNAFEIHLNNMIHTKDFELMKSRAKEYSDIHNIKITKFRLVKRAFVENSVDIT